MNRTIALLLALLAIAPAPSLAQDFVIRIEATGYFDSTEAMPKEKLLWSIEAVGHPGGSFSQTVRNGNDKLELHGQMKWQDKSQLEVDYVHDFAVGVTLETGDQFIHSQPVDRAAAERSKSASETCSAAVTARRDLPESPRSVAVIECT